MRPVSGVSRSPTCTDTNWCCRGRMRGVGRGAVAEIIPGTVLALRARRTGLRDLRLGLLTRVYARRLRVHVDAGRDAGRGAATSVGDFGRRLPAAPTSRGDVELRFPPRVRSRLPPATRVLGAYGLRVGSRITARVRLEGELGLRAVLGCASYWAALLGCVN